MHLISNEVVEFQEIDVSDCYLLCKRFTAPAVIENAFTGLLTTFREIGFGEHIKNFFLCCSIKYRGFCSDVEFMACPSKMDFQDLTDVHSRGDTQRVQHQLNRRTVRKIGHILLRQNFGNNTFIAITTCHLIAHRNRTLAGNIDFHTLNNAGFQLIAHLQLLKCSFFLFCVSGDSSLCHLFNTLDMFHRLGVGHTNVREGQTALFACLLIVSIRD